MRELGFTDYRPQHWYLCRRVGGADVTLNITIDKATGDYEGLVMDEAFGQPYYYGRYDNDFAKAIRPNVDAVLADLQNAGLMVEVDHEAYGCAVTA